MGNLEHGYWACSDSPVCGGELTKRFEGCFIRDMLKSFHELQSELLHFFQCLSVVVYDGIGCLNRIFKVRADERFVQGVKNIGRRAAKGRFR